MSNADQGADLSADPKTDLGNELGTRAGSQGINDRRSAEPESRAVCLMRL